MRSVSPSCERQLVQIRIIRIACLIPIHLKMNSEMFGAWSPQGKERLVDRVLHTIESERKKHGLPVADLAVDGQVIPTVQSRPLAGNISG
jgi:hypothetical protein